MRIFICILLCFSFSSWPLAIHEASLFPVTDAQKSVWRISPSGGTGFFIAPDIFVTNFHVIFPPLPDINTIPDKQT